MWEDLLKQKIESRLLEAVHCAHLRYYSGECDQSDYANSLKTLNEFLVDGKWPADLAPIERPR